MLKSGYVEYKLGHKHGKGVLIPGGLHSFYSEHRW